MNKYDFFIAGRWRNRDNIIPVLKMVRDAGFSAYCFIENEYSMDNVEIKIDGNPEKFMSDLESLGQDHPMIKKIFEIDIEAESSSTYFLLVLPAGIAGHIEAGAAYGMGKKCYAIGQIEKTETLYCIFKNIFKNKDELAEWLHNEKKNQLI